MTEVIIMAPARRRRDWLEDAIRAEPSLRVAGTASSFPFLRSLLSETAADVVIVDLESAADSATARDWMFEILEMAPIVLLAAAADASIYSALVRAGKGAWLRGDAAADQVVRAVQSAAAGLLAFDSSLIPQPESAGDFAEELTPRESEVLGLLAEGLPNREIASRLNVSEHTIKFHIRSILGKLGASTRTEAVARGLRSGLIEL
jgi:DNA-binding NarL/FixJ family response regulator